MYFTSENVYGIIKMGNFMEKQLCHINSKNGKFINF